jgi:hypothetical protein
MYAAQVAKPRPYWYVDAKWISGLLLLFSLPITIIIFILAQITAPQQGISLLTVTLASSYSAQAGGLDATGDIAIMRQKIADSPNGAWQPIPGMRIFVRAADIAGKTPREVRLWFFRQWAEPLYYSGTLGLTNLITDPSMQQGLAGGAGPLGIISAKTHRTLLGMLLVSGLVSLVFLIALIVFSYRFGRVGCPGCIVFVAAFPGFAILTAAGAALRQYTQPTAGSPQETFITRYVQLVADALPDVVQKAAQIYLYLMVAGFILVLIGLIGTVVYAISKQE